jgi:hypothetical protein
VEVVAVVSIPAEPLKEAEAAVSMPAKRRPKEEAEEATKQPSSVTNPSTSLLHCRMTGKHDSSHPERGHSMHRAWVVANHRFS